MPNIYREKDCPRCKSRHRKRGPFCSRKCADIHRSARTVTEDHKKAISAGVREYYDTPAGLAKRTMMSQKPAQGSTLADDFYINIPDIKENPTVESGDIWSSTDW
jgi:endogenous inhibitor of DNA gyrase (YacG/DUF329 family)